PAINLDYLTWLKRTNAILGQPLMCIRQARLEPLALSASSRERYPTRCAANTSRPRSDRFWLRELRVSQHFSTFYEPSVQAVDTQLNALPTLPVLARSVSGCLSSAFLGRRSSRGRRGGERGREVLFQGDSAMRVLVTGGAGFIGSHLCEAYLERGDEVHVLDDLSTGSIDNIRHLRSHSRFDYTIDSVHHKALTAELVDDCDAVIHLAAAVGVKLIVESPVRT